MDTIANFLNQLKTTSQAGRSSMTVRFSNLKFSMLKVLKNNGYVVDFMVDKDKKFIEVTLKNQVFEHVRRVSKPGRRVYAKATHIPKPLSGYGLVILSTPKGVVSGKEAKKLGLGGEILCEIW